MKELFDVVYRLTLLNETKLSVNDDLLIEYENYLVQKEVCSFIKVSKVVKVIENYQLLYVRCTYFTFDVECTLAKALEYEEYIRYTFYEYFNAFVYRISIVSIRECYTLPTSEEEADDFKLFGPHELYSDICNDSKLKNYYNSRYTKKCKKLYNKRKFSKFFM